MVDSGADVPVASPVAPPVASPPPAPAAAASTPVVPATNGASTTHSTSHSNGSTPAPPTPAGEALAEPSSTVVAPSAEPGATPAGATTTGATTTGASEATPASSTSASGTAPRTPAAAGAGAAPGTATAPAPRSVSTPAPPRKRGRPPKNAQAQSNNPTPAGTPAGTPAAAPTVGDSTSCLNGQVSSVPAAPLVPPPPPEDPLEDVTLTDEERRKMLVVLHSLDPSHILSQPITSPDAPPVTLSELLSNASSTIPHLRANLNTACTTSLVLSFTTEPPLQCAIESFRSTALGMLTELGRLHLRKRSSTTAPNEDSKTAMTLPRPTKKYMLHRSLAGGVDLFSSTTVFSDEEVQSLSTLQDTDVVSVHALTFPSSTTSAPAPTLGHLNPRPYVQTRPPRPLPRSKPSQMLYYDPFQSFAPSYDSSGATLDYQRSVAYVDSRTRVYEWERDLVEARDGGEVGSEEGLKALQGLAGKELELINEVLGTEEWKKVVEMQAEAVKVEEVEAGDVDARLKRNKALLEKLIKAQLARTLLPPLPPPPPKMGPHESGLLAGEAENQTADKLISSLSTILQSIAPSNSATERRRVFPPVDRVRAATPRIMQRLAKDECSFGNLDPYNWRALKESTLVPPPKLKQ